MILRVLSSVSGLWTKCSPIICSAPAIGAFYMLFLYGWCTFEPLVPPDETLLGKDASDIANYVAVRFAREIRDIFLTLGAISLAIGLALGVIAHAILTVRRGPRPAVQTKLWKLALARLLLVVLLHAITIAAAMARWPQLFAPTFWSRGGVLAALQRAVTDRIGSRDLGFITIAILAVLLLPATWRWLPPRSTRVVSVGVVLRVAMKTLAATALAAIFVFGDVALEKTREGSRSRTPPLPSSSPPDPKAPRGPSMLILASDGLRDDRVRPDLMPHLSALADRGTRFDHVYVELPRTLPSWVTILTGLRAQHHGVRSSFPRFDDGRAPLDTLPMRLRSMGYTTAAVSDYAGDIFGRLDFGFSFLDVPEIAFPSFLSEQAVARTVPILPFAQTTPGRELVPTIRRWSAASDPSFVADSAIDVLRRVHTAPFFLIVFFSTTHFPYAAPAPYHARFATPDYDGPYRYAKTVMADVPLIPNAADVKQIRALYDGAAVAVDDAAGRVLHELDLLGEKDRTIVVVTSDHGETLFEHDRWHGHGDHLFGDESTHVPLVIADPRAPPTTTNNTTRRVTALASNIDIEPTLAELLAAPPPKNLRDGRSLAPLMRGQSIDERPVFAETELRLGRNPGIAKELDFPALGLRQILEVDDDHGNHLVVRKSATPFTLLTRQRMVRDEKWKLLYIPTPTGVVYQLFDVVKDPEEIVDLSTHRPEETERLKRILWDWMLADPLMTKDGDYLVMKGSSAPTPAPPPQSPKATP